MNYFFDSNRSSCQNYFSTFYSRLPSIIDVCLPTKLQQKFGDVSIIFHDTSKIDIYCYPREGHIHLHAGVLDFLWHSCYLNYSAYSQSYFANPNVGEDQIDNSYIYVNNPQRNTCVARLSSLIKGIDKGYANIPLPDPNYDTTDGTMSSIAADVMLYAVGAALLHEFAHISCYREDKVLDAVDEENYADAFASTNFISDELLNRCPESKRSNFKLKLLWSITELCFFLFKLDFCDGHGETHPNSIRRFENIITQHSNILNLRSDLDYKIENGFDIRPVIGYAAYVLQSSFQLHLYLNKDERKLREFQDIVISRPYASPLDFYQSIRKYIADYTDQWTNS